MDYTEDKARFIELLRSTQRAGIDQMLAWMETTDIFIAPASTKYHGSYPGGLIRHCLTVYEELVRLNETYSPVMGQIPPDSVIIMALLHDLCKVDTYKSERRNRKNDAGAWESYLAYTSSEKFPFGGHGSKSVYIAMKFIQLTDLEAVAINCHMATWEEGRTYATGESFRQYPQAWLLHVADEASTFVRNA